MLKVLTMPLAAGGAIALGFVVYARVRRWIEGRTPESDRPRWLRADRLPENERDPVGPPDSRPSRSVHPLRITTEAEVAAVLGSEWPLPPSPDEVSGAPAVNAEVEAWLTDAEFPDEETAPTEPGMRFDRAVPSPGRSNGSGDR